MPLNLAMALLSDERLDNTHQRKQLDSNAVPQQSNAPKSSGNTTYVSTVRKHSESR
ncbi:hypothetical protein [Acinetobacter sp. ANC 4470]|uniref:hypothetical protein n=1 Tax=Acinetobacter sp. ANC 4470 TaxID=1977881 RepID=UPI00148A6478|nr:hypothetical protein [Acinetobacter sp. ANC 4470]